MKTVLVLLATGLPFALFFAWAFEMTPEGVKREKDVDRDLSLTPQTGRKLDRTIIATLALAVIFLVYDRFTAPEVPAGTPALQQTEPASEANEVADIPVKSIAVLPFSNLSSDSETDSFVAGLHDDLLTQLSKVQDLKVISRTSVLRYAATTRSINEIAAELGVATIMEGGIQRSGDRVRINVQLIDSDTDEHMWAETYDRVLTTENVFDIQSEITRQIALALEAALTPAEEARLAERPTNSMPAYEAYLESKLLEERYQGLGEDVLDQAISAAQLAVELDPLFVEAWTQLAFVHLSRFWYKDRSQNDVNAARAAIEKASALNPESTEVGLMLGLYFYWVNYDYAAALPELDRVLAVEPGNERAWAIRGWVLRRWGRWDEALDSMKKAASLNPNSVENMAEVGDTLAVLNHFSEAADWLQAAQARIPGNIMIGNTKARLILSTTGNPGPLVANLRENILLENPTSTDQLDYVMTEAMHGDIQRALDYLDDWSPGTIDVQYQFWPQDLLRAYILHGAGRTEEAAVFAEKALPLIEAAQRFEPNEPDIEKAKGYALALMGRKDEAEAAARRIRQIYPRSHDSWGGADFLFGATEILAIANHNALALEWLDDYLTGGGAIMTLMAIGKHPGFATLVKGPGFTTLIEEHGLVPEDQSP